jgi:hypothetical protein
MGGTVIGGCVGVNLMYNEMTEEGYNEMMNTRWGRWVNFVFNFGMLCGGAIFGGSFGSIIGWTFPVSFPILGLLIWDDYEKNKRKVKSIKD